MTMMFDLFRREPEFVRIHAGEYLFREGDLIEEKMYVLVAGKASILVNQKVLEEAVAGTIVGEMGLITPHELRSATVRAESDCEFVEIVPKRFRYLVTEAPHFAMEVMRVMAGRLRHTNHMLA